MVTFPWFKKMGILFIPSSMPGWIILLTCMIYAVYIFIDIDSRSHSVSDTLMNFVFNFLILGVVYTVIGFLTSRKNNGERHEF